MKIYLDSCCFDEPTWVCVYKGGYLHTSISLPHLIWEVITEYCNDRHLVG